MDIQRGDGQAHTGPAESFRGEVWVEDLVSSRSGPGLDVLKVHFPPGTRNAWHSHPRGQVLYVTEGTGLVQARGGRVERIVAGDTVVAEAGEWHWHGAGPDTFMTHIAIQGGGDNGTSVQWGEHVSEDE